MKQKYRICLAEDHAIVRDGLRVLLSMEPEFEVVAEVEDGLKVLSCIKQCSPDLLIIDISMPKISGLEVIPEIKKRYPDLKILVLSVHCAEEYVHAALHGGANGYLLKDSNRIELVLAIRSVLIGRTFISPGIAAIVTKGYLEGRGSSRPNSTWDTLTHREREILKLIGEGYKNKEIAGYLCISIKTVEKHRGNLMNKLDRHNAASLTEYAMEKGLVTANGRGGQRGHEARMTVPALGRDSTEKEPPDSSVRSLILARP